MELLNVEKKVINIVNEINSYDYSSIEKIMHAYDLVRDGVLDLANESNYLFDGVLKQLGIDTKLIELTNSDTNNEHKRIQAHIKDEKYGIDGVYYFDPSLDTVSFDSYQYFAKNLEELLTIDYFNKLEFKQKTEYISTVSKELHASILLKILYKVRTNEYYNNPIAWQYEPITFYKSMIKSYWSFEEDKCFFEQVTNKYKPRESWCKHQVIVFKRFCEYHELYDKMKKVIDSRKAGIALDSSIEIKETKK